MALAQDHQTNQFKGTGVTYREEKVVNATSQLLTNADRVDSCGDYKAPSILFEAYKSVSPQLKEREKHIKLRFLTDINRDNIIFCKEIMKFAKEVRHLEGVKANFSISKTEYISIITSNEIGQSSSSPKQSQILYSNVNGIIEQ